MSLLRQHRDDFPYITNETHVEHAVCFVEDEIIALRELHMPLVHQIEKPARCCNENIDAAFEGLNLRAT